MPIPQEDRPLNAVREETIDQLILNYGHGKLSLEAFERRLDQALDAGSHEKLTALTGDLEHFADAQYAARKRAELGIKVDAAESGDDVEHMISIFGGHNRGGAWDVPPNIRMVNLFGGTDLDFSEAHFSSPTTRVTMLTLFGGAQFRVREGMRVVSKALCIFGGVTNRASSTTDRNAPTLIIQGLVLFGGADIRIKRTAKERWCEFAEGIRSMFGPTT